jgi:hypothetical protein
VKNSKNIAAMVVAMLLWGIYLGYPLQQLQDLRMTFLGYGIPIYYFFIVLPVIAAGAFVLMAKRGWMKWETLWWLLPLACLPGILRSDDRLWSVRQYCSWAVRGIIPGGILFLTADRKKLRTMLLCWIYPVIVAAGVLGLSELFTYHNILWKGVDPHISQTNQPDNPFYRPGEAMALSVAPQGTQGNRIPYAATLLSFFPLGLWLLKYKKKYYWINLLALNILFSILLLAYVRAVWLAAIATMFFLPLAGLKRKWKENAAVGAGMLLCLAAALAWPTTNRMLRRRLDSFILTDSSIRERLAVFQTAAVLKDRWLFGIGFGQFPTVCKSFFHGAMPWIGTPDNQYFRWAVENGLLSFILLLSFCAGLIRTGWKKIQLMEDIQQADFYKSILVGWMSLAVTFLFFDGFYWGASNMTFWCLLGIFATCLNPAQAA